MRFGACDGSEAINFIQPLLDLVCEVRLNVLFRAGDINSLREWWNYLNSLGPNYGYHTNANKRWLVTKGELHDKAIEAFEGTGVHITTEGKTIPRGAHWHLRHHLHTIPDVLLLPWPSAS